MSGIFPDSPVPNRVRVSSLQPSRVSVAQSLRRQVRASGSQRFRINLSWAPMSRDQAAALTAFAEAQQGRAGTFTYVPALEGSTRGSCSSVVTVDGAHAAGESTIALSGANADLLTGDYLVFAGHSKVYRVTSGGSAEIDINPPLMEPLASSEGVTYTEVPFTVALANDLQEYDIGVGQRYIYSVQFDEDY